MSKLPSIAQELYKLEKPFTAQNQWGMTFANECLFAKQQITRNNHTLSVAQENPESLRSAILNVAAIGISLNPANAHAFLVPRDKQICLDISYRGLIKLGTDCGAILWAKAETVYEGDDFKWRGFTEVPHHEFDPFSTDRMDLSDPFKGLRGGYCVAQLPGGGWLVDRMTAAEIIKVKETSKANAGPWHAQYKDKWGNIHKGWPEEMIKKALVKRAYKSWPQTEMRERLDHAVHVINQHEGISTANPADEKMISDFMDLVAEGKGLPLLKYMTSLTEDQQAACFNAAPKGEKTKLKDRVREIQSQAQCVINEYVTQITELCQSEDPAALDLYAELDDIERTFVDARMTDITHRQLANLEKEAA